MKKFLYILIIAFCVSFILISFNQSENVYAKSVVTIGPDSCTIDVKIYIAFYGRGASQELIDRWTENIREAFKAKKYKSGKCKCPVEIEVIATVVKNKERCPHDFHCVEIYHLPARSFITLNEPFWLWWNKWQGLGSEKESPSRTGEFHSSDTTLILMHELGHLLGLDDEYEIVYDKNGNVVEIRCKPPTPPGESPSLMCQVNALLLPEFKQSHIDDITGWIICPGRCCCGNEILEVERGEECDPPYSSRLVGSKCGTYTKSCTKKCKWTGSPPTCCGDEIIQKPNDLGQNEECENDTDCSENKICCPETCRCLNK